MPPHLLSSPPFLSSPCSSQWVGQGEREEGGEEEGEASGAKKSEALFAQQATPFFLFL